MRKQSILVPAIVVLTFGQTEADWEDFSWDFEQFSTAPSASTGEK